MNKKLAMSVFLVVVMLMSMVTAAGASPAAIAKNGCAQVYNANGSGGLAVRATPSTSGTLIKRISDGTIVKITDGPVSSGGYTWWKHDQGGWSAGSYLKDANCPGSGDPILDALVTLNNGRVVKVRDLDGLTPVKGMDSTYGKPGQWQLDAPVKSSTSNRNPTLYRSVINQFGVGNNPRYTPSGQYTFCNTFAGDVMRAMGVPFPTKKEYFGKNDQATIGFPDLYNWLNNQPNGWKKVNLATLVAYVNAGKPGIVVTTGHIAVVRPGQGNVTKNSDLHIAQAGAAGKISNDITLYFTVGFFMVHE